MTRWPVPLVLVLTAAIAVGCKDSDGSPGGGAGPDPASAKQQEDLLARRDALLRSRQQILDEQARLDAERAELVQSGADTSEIDKKKEELATREQALASQETQLLDAFQSQLAELSALRAAGADQTARVAARETSMATREKTVAWGQAAIADRERRLAVRERETCSAPGVPTTIIQTVDAKGSKYSKRDVEPVLRKAREVMARKGILAADLPAPAQELEREATTGMASGDYGAAYLAARTLAGTVDAVRIDRAFIAAKIGRLSQRMKGVKLDAGKQKQVDQLFADATSRYGDGDFAGANRKLNQIVAMIQ
jgi:hypothetical protein